MGDSVGTVTISLKSDDKIPCPSSAIVVPLNIGRAQLQEVVRQCIADCANSEEWLAVHAQFAYDLLGVPVIDSLADTIDECNAIEQIVSLESELPISVWLPLPAPHKSINIATDVWTMDMFVDPSFVASCQLDGGLLVNGVVDGRQIARRCVSGDVFATGSNKGANAFVEPLSHRCVAAWQDDTKELRLVVGGSRGSLLLGGVRDGAIVVDGHLIGHSADVSDVAIHRGHEHIASVDEGGLLKLWSAQRSSASDNAPRKKARKQSRSVVDDITEEGEKTSPLVTLDMGSACRSVAWAPNNEHECIVAGHLDCIFTVDTTMAKVTHRRPCARAIDSMSVHAVDERVIVACLDDNIRVFDKDGQRSIVRSVGGTCRAAIWTEGIHEHAFAALIDNDTSNESCMTLWDARYADGAVHKRRVLYKEENRHQRMLRLAQCPDGQGGVTVAAACERGVQTWRVDSRETALLLK